MTTFLGPDDETNDTASRRKRGQNGVACFLHLRDLVYLHPGAASASAVSFVQTFEAKVIAEKGARAREARRRARREAAAGPATALARPASGPWAGIRQAGVVDHSRKEYRYFN
jgi:hypothetical protein